MNLKEELFVRALTSLLVLQAQILVPVSGNTTVSASEKDLYILGLFPVSGFWPAGKALVPAAQLVLELINKDPHILSGYQLKMIWDDTKSDADESVRILARRMCGDKKFLMVLGAGVSKVTIVVARAAYLWNMVQVSYGALTVQLSDTKQFPHFYRVYASDKILNIGRVALMKHFKWKKIWTLYDKTFELFSLLIEDFQVLAANEGLSLENKFEFKGDPTDAIKKLKENDARIIIGAFYDDKAEQVFCQAYKLKFFGPRIVWILPGYMTYGWVTTNETNCTAEELKASFGNHFSVDTYSNLTRHINSLDIKFSKFWDEYLRKMHNKLLLGYLRVPYVYDALYAMAHALNATIRDLRDTDYRLEDFTYTDNDVGRLMNTNMDKVNFTTYFGQVSFSKNGESRKDLVIEQYQDDKMVQLGWYDRFTKGEPFTWSTQDTVYWVNGVVPYDSRRVVFTMVEVSDPLHIIMCLLAAFGILLALSLLFINIKFSNLRIIKMSSPNINNIILMGCIISYCFVFIHGIDNKDSVAICQIKSYLLVTGFSLIYSSLFAKTWRVYVVFMASEKLKKKVMTDMDLFIKIGVFTAFNILILIVWTIIDPSKPKKINKFNMAVEDDANDRSLVPVKWECLSKYHTYFYAILISIQALLLFFGVCLAFTTRKVTISALNDSKSIGLCIYVVILLSVVGLPASLLSGNSLNLTYGLFSGIIIFGTTCIQCIIFIPKVLALKSFLQGDETQCRSMFLLHPPETPSRSGTPATSSNKHTSSQ